MRTFSAKLTDNNLTQISGKNHTAIKLHFRVKWREFLKSLQLSHRGNGLRNAQKGFAERNVCNLSNRAFVYDVIILA